MQENSSEKQPLERRSPRQARALYKVGLILEATVQLLEQGGMAALTTNAIAERAGVSIGTLYQYFGDKQAILDALAERELAGISERVLAAVAGVDPAQPGDRVRWALRAQASAFGGRSRVRRLLMQHALARGQAAPLQELYAGLAALLSSPGMGLRGQALQPLSAMEARVLTQAIAGVMRGVLTQLDEPVQRQVAEDALVKLVLGFFGVAG